MKGCDLCSHPARIYCEADRASLCSDCDEKVHCANFLVAKHSRSLLCHVCQSPTPWKASGAKLGSTISVCESCVDNCIAKRRGVAEGDRESQGGNGDDEKADDSIGEYDYSDDDDESDAECDDGESEDEDGDNQVVPWSSAPTQPPATTSSSSSEQVSSSRFSSANGEFISTRKRTRENADLDYEDGIGCASSRFNYNIETISMTCQPLENEEATSSGSRRSPKQRRPGDAFQSEKVLHRSELESRSTVAIFLSSLEKLQQTPNTSSNIDASAMVLGIHRLSRDPVPL